MEGLAAYASDSEENEPLEEDPPPKRLKVDPSVLPPEPPGSADPELAKRLIEWRSKGSNPSQHIRQNREFANPQILQKIVEYFAIDDIASCYPKHLFDPQAIVARRAPEKDSNSDKKTPSTT